MYKPNVMLKHLSTTKYSDEENDQNYLDLTKNILNEYNFIGKLICQK